MVSALATREAPGTGLDLGPLPDERLVTLARESGHQPARDELLARTARQRSALVGRLARGARLTQADRQDACQEAVLWTLEAIRHYHGEPAPSPGGCRFRSFLHRVIRCRFVDFTRRQSRYRRQVVLVGVTFPPRLDGLDGPAAPRRPGAGDPPESGPQAFEAGELSDRLARQLDRLGERERGLWELLARGASVREVSAVLNVSYDAAKRRRRKLVLQLRTLIRWAR
jgi:RNA polymerase sigma factor (sigma-70 family)